MLHVPSDLFPCRQKRIRDNQSLPSAYLYHSTNERPWAVWEIPTLLGGHLLNSYGPLTRVSKCSGMPGPSSIKSCFCRWKKLQSTLCYSELTVLIKLYPIQYMETDMLLNLGLKCSQLPSDIQQAALPLFILGKENKYLPLQMHCGLGVQQHRNDRVSEGCTWDKNS